jgi:hypothetical protein
MDMMAITPNVMTIKNTSSLSSFSAKAIRDPPC